MFRLTATLYMLQVQSQALFLFELSRVLGFHYSRIRCIEFWDMVSDRLWVDCMFVDRYQGWGNSVLALVCLVIGCPAPFVFYRYGPRLRAWSKAASVEQ
jgi:hypothetical protein